MKLRYNILVLVILCLFLTLLDILLVEVYYRPLNEWSKIWIWWAILGTIVVIAPVVLTYSIRNLIPLAMWLFFVFGLEDTVFYGLQGYLPNTYFGVYIFGFWEPTLRLVLQVNALGLIAVSVFVIKNKEFSKPKIICRPKN